MIDLAEYSWNWIRRLKIKYHLWRAERLFARWKRLRREASKVYVMMKVHTIRASNLVEEAKL